MKRLSNYSLVAVILFLLSLLIYNNLSKKETCALLGTAFTESSELAPGWYSQAGIALESCGVQRAKVLGEYKACLSSKNSYSDTDCTAEEKAYDKLFEEDK